MVEIDSRPVNKSSDGKKSYPHKKNVFRKCDSKGKFIEDFVVSDLRSSEFSIYTSLLSTYIENGKTIKKHPELIYSREHHIEQFAQLDNSHKSIIQPHTYPVTMSL